MSYPPTTISIKCDLQTQIKSNKWGALVDGGNGFLYGIPFRASRVVEFNPTQKAFKEIGPDLGVQDLKYWSGIRADNGSIYCIPYASKYVLKITPKKGGDAEIQFLEDKKLPLDGFDNWRVGCLANDGCIYYLPTPCGAKNILKLDPYDDNLSLIGEDLGWEEGYEGAVVGKDGCIYGIPSGSSNSIMIFHPFSLNVTYMNGDWNEDNEFEGGILASDGNIYTLNQFGQVLKVDVSNKSFSIIGNKIYDEGCRGWGLPMLGADKCIYFPPLNHDRVLTFNPSTQSIYLVGDSLKHASFAWNDSVLALDDFIYCIPMSSNYFLQIDTRQINEQILEFVGNIDARREYLIEPMEEEFSEDSLEDMFAVDSFDY